MKHFLYLIPILIFCSFQTFASDDLTAVNGLYGDHPVVAFYAEERYDLMQIENLVKQNKTQSSLSYYMTLQEEEKNLKDARAQAVCQFTNGVDVKDYTTEYVKTGEPIKVWDFRADEMPRLVFASRKSLATPLEIFKYIICQPSKVSVPAMPAARRHTHAPLHKINSLAKNKKHRAVHKINFAEKQKTRPDARGGP